MNLAPRTIRYLGLIAMVTGLIGLLNWPFHSSAYFLDGHPPEEEGLLASAWSGPFLAVASPLLSWSEDPHTVYMFYGRITSLVALGLFPGVLALHAVQKGRGGRLEEVGYRMAALSTGLLGAAVIVEYWTPYLNEGFMFLSVPAILLSMVSFPLFGAGTLKARVAPRAAGWLLAAGAFPGILMMTVLIGHLSAGLLLLNVAWVIAGYALWSGSLSHAQAHAPAPAPA